MSEFDDAVAQIVALGKSREVAEQLVREQRGIERLVQYLSKQRRVGQLGF